MVHRRMNATWFICTTLACLLFLPSSEGSAMSNDAALKSIAPSGGALEPPFIPAKTTYYMFLSSDVESVALTATANEEHATLTVNGTATASGAPSAAVALKPGRNDIPITVTAQDGKTRRTYLIKALRRYPMPDWQQVQAKAPWKPRDSQGELVFRNAMWVFGGYTPKLVNDVWRSTDGVEWTHVGDLPNTSGVNIPVNFVHQDKMWIVAQNSSFYSSADGKTWELATNNPPWGKRYAPGGAVFKGRMWVLGGRRGRTLHNDIWSSEDGANWTCEVKSAPWSPRQLFAMVVVFKDQLWLMGGGVTNYHPFRGYRDVWRSEDGKNWTQVTDQAPWPARIWSSAAVYRNRLWVLGGYRSEPKGVNFGDVWYSADGETWHELKTDTIWSERHELSAMVFDDSLWVVGGNSWPLKNDAWRLHIPGMIFVTQPPVEDYEGAQYTYRARADFHASGGPVTYRLTEAPEWLDIDERTGVIRGLAPKVGHWTVTVEASDDAGETARQSYTLHIVQ